MKDTVDNRPPFLHDNANLIIRPTAWNAFARIVLSKFLCFVPQEPHPSTMRDHRSLGGLQVNCFFCHHEEARAREEEKGSVSQPRHLNQVLTTIFGLQFVQTFGFIYENRSPIEVEDFLFGSLILGTAVGNTRGRSRNRAGGGGNHSSPLLVEFDQQLPPIRGMDRVLHKHASNVPG